jgi:hypothetical protein
VKVDRPPVTRSSPSIVSVPGPVLMRSPRNAPAEAMAEFKVAGGNVTGRVITGKELDAFGEKWEVDLTFAAPLPEKLRNAPTPAEKPTTKPREQAKAEPKAPASPQPVARKLPLPGDATDVQFKQLVEQIQFSIARAVPAVAGEFSSKLKQQGGKESGRDLMGKTNVILKRERGDAKLTIMVQPAAGGSVVKIFTQGLDWSGSDEAKPPAAKKAADDDDNDADALEPECAQVEHHVEKVSLRWDGKLLE